jgi:hypothetical protein
VHNWLESKEITDEQTEGLGFYRDDGKIRSINGRPGKLRNFEVHSVRPVRRIGPDGQQLEDLVIEITQSWLPDDGGAKVRGGCTLIVDLEKQVIRYVMRKRVGHPDRLRAQDEFRSGLAQDNLGFNYFGETALKRDPFAMLHRGM